MSSAAVLIDALSLYFCFLATVQNGQAGVRYITEDLIRKISKEDSLEMVTTLNLTLSKEGGKKIKVIFSF